MNVTSRKIHNGEKPCPSVRSMAMVDNLKSFDNLEDAETFFEGEIKKPTLCGRCYRKGKVD